MNFSIEDLDKALAHKNILSTSYGHKSTVMFKRCREIIINKRMYHIEWYINKCFLYTMGLTIPFNFVKQANTWPNHSKMNLQFYNGSGVCCILVLERL